MITVPFNSIDVDRCTNCQGLWFDEFEKAELQKLKGSDAIDVGIRRRVATSTRLIASNARAVAAG
jgi:Zn-finger nucleic acid-binding protein